MDVTPLCCSCRQTSSRWSGGARAADFSLCVRKFKDIWRLLGLIWPYVCMDGEKLKQHQTLSSDQLTDMLNKTTCHTGHLTASLQVHITWGRPRILSEKKHLDCLQGRKLIAHSGSWCSRPTPKFNSYLGCSHQPDCSLKYKRHWLCLLEQRLISHSQNVQALSWCSYSIGGSLNKVRGHQITKGKTKTTNRKAYILSRPVQWVENGFLICLCTCILCLHWWKCASLKLKDHVSYLAPGRGQLCLFPVEWYCKSPNFFKCGNSWGS